MPRCLGPWSCCSCGLCWCPVTTEGSEVKVLQSWPRLPLAAALRRTRPAPHHLQHLWQCTHWQGCKWADPESGRVGELAPHLLHDAVCPQCGWALAGWPTDHHSVAGYWLAGPLTTTVWLGTGWLIYWAPQCSRVLTGCLVANECSWWVTAFSLFTFPMDISVLPLSWFLSFTRLTEAVFNLIGSRNILSPKPHILFKNTLFFKRNQ